MDDLRSVVAEPESSAAMHSARSSPQPVAASGVVGIHNGIVVNHEALWAAHPDLRRQEIAFFFSGLELVG